MDNTIDVFVSFIWTEEGKDKYLVELWGKVPLEEGHLWPLAAPPNPWPKGKLKKVRKEAKRKRKMQAGEMFGLLSPTQTSEGA